MRSRIVWFLFLSFALAVSVVAPAFAGAAADKQSLGDAARKERERREKNKETGVAVREISEAEVFGEEEKPDVASETNVDEAGTEGTSNPDSATRGERSPLIPDRIDIDLEKDDAEDETDAIEDEARARTRREAEWRTRFQEARGRVAAAREQKQVLDGVHHVPGIKYVDENGNVVIESLEELRALVAEADRELEDAERALRELENQARREGVPPGWRR